MAHRIIIEAIPYDQQRYATQGDWRVDDNGDWVISVTGNNLSSYQLDDQALLYAYHELTEMILCMKAGITQQMVDDFDFSNVETANENGEELGDMERCPYRQQHRRAMIAEILLAEWIGIQGYGKVE